MKSHEDNSLNTFVTLLSVSVSSLTITGVAAIDGQFWNVVLKVLGLIAYGIVGILISIGLLNGRKASFRAYLFILGLLILGAFEVYRLLTMFKQWVLDWPLFVKILVPSVLFVLVVIIVILKIIISKQKKDSKEKESEDEVLTD